VSRRRAALTAAFKAVRQVLWQDWDPIGGVPEDEYDAYVWPVVGHVLRGDDRAVLEDYLRRTAAKTMGCPSSDAHVRDVVDKLLALGLGPGKENT
jgi:hypothetical protein